MSESEERTFCEFWGVSITMRTWVMHVPRVTDKAMVLVCVFVYRGGVWIDRYVFSHR